MRQDIILKPWQIELTTNSTNDSFEESTFFTGNGRMGIRGYLPFWQEKRTFETGLFVAGIFGEIKPGITDFVNLPTPVWGNIECDGHPITLSSPVASTLDMKTGVRSQSFLAKSGETTLNIEHQVFLQYVRSLTARTAAFFLRIAHLQYRSICRNSYCLL